MTALAVIFGALALVVALIALVLAGMAVMATAAIGDALPEPTSDTEGTDL